MSYSCGNSTTIDKEEIQDFVIDGEVENDDQEHDNDDDGMDVQHYGVDFWALQHPMEPPDEDMPVKIPMPDSSVISNEGEIHEERRDKSSRKRPELEKMMNNKNRRVTENAEPTISPIRQMRKRDHDMLSSGQYYTMTPLMRMPPDLSTLPADHKTITTTTIFQMLQQFDS